MNNLHLIDFFENFDSSDPYMRAAISELQNAMPKDLLDSRSDWFITWTQAGKREKASINTMKVT